MSQIKWADLPEEIKEKMLEHQEAQTGKRDAGVFIGQILSDYPQGGIKWDDTPEKHAFWEKIIYQGEIAHFYTKYPKPTPKQEEEVLTASKEYKHYPEPVEMMVSDHNSHNSEWLQRKVFGELVGFFLAICKEGETIMWWRCAKPIPQKIKLPAKDVSEGKGVGIQPELIEFV